MLAQGAYQMDSASERIKLGSGPGQGTGGKQTGRTPALTTGAVTEYARSGRRVARKGPGHELLTGNGAWNWSPEVQTTADLNGPAVVQR